MKLSNQNKTILTIVGSLLLIFVISGGLLIWNYNMGKNKELDEVILNNNKGDSSMFAIMLEQDDGTYDKSSSNKWPTSRYKYSEGMSGCIDTNGNSIDNALSYDTVNNKVILRIQQVSMCYLYFSYSPDIKVNNVDLTKLNSGRYIKSLDCGSTGSATFDTKYQRFEFSSVVAPAECTIKYIEDTANYPKLNQTIIDMAVEGTSDGTGQAAGDVVHETFKDANNNNVDTGYRYEGKSPKNYIWFNNELWRIIGVFDTCTSLDDQGNCTKTETLTKIMRNESIGGLVWNKGSNINWPSSSLYKLLNPVAGDNLSGAYINSTNGTNSGYCYGYQGTVKVNCDYSEIGLKGLNSYYGRMIKNVVWNLGGMNTNMGTENYYGSPASTWYTYERGTIVYSGSDTKTTGYIGLMYGSDYGYSVKASRNCNRSKKLSSYNTAYCASESWMYGQGYEWMISPCSNGYSGSAWNVASDGSFAPYSVSYDAFAVRPVLYLDSSVYVINGEEENVGAISNPYQIGK